MSVIFLESWQWHMYILVLFESFGSFPAPHTRLTGTGENLRSWYRLKFQKYLRSVALGVGTQSGQHQSVTIGQSSMQWFTATMVTAAAGPIYGDSSTDDRGFRASIVWGHVQVRTVVDGSGTSVWPRGRCHISDKQDKSLSHLTTALSGIKKWGRWLENHLVFITVFGMVSICVTLLITGERQTFSGSPQVIMNNSCKTCNA